MHHVHILNSVPLAYYDWPADPQEVRGVVQISHGMVEHLGRYDTLANQLNSLGFHVVGADHRGHGHSVQAGTELGDFGDGATWADVVKDLHAVRAYTQSTVHIDLPYFFVGHSMGSFALRQYLRDYGQGVAGAAIIGTGLWPSPLADAGLAIARLSSALAPRRPGRLLNKLSFGPYNKRFEGRTEFDWLSRDTREVDAYVADPLCGVVPSHSFFRHMLAGLKAVNHPDTYNIDSALPIYIASGSADPVGGEAAVTEVSHRYRANGNTVETRVYPNARHEIFHEINRTEVINDLAAWLISLT